MYWFDTERKARPWHIHDADDAQHYVFALCGKILDARPRGVDVAFDVEDDLVCGICLRKQAEAVPA